MRIHQAILGYDRGHRLLAASKGLSSISKHQLVQLSDRSVDVKNLPKSGYLTGYPLPEDGLYVVARTWGAPEMPRPGCIWTHSLFVSFTELARLDDPRYLLPLFKRPNDIDSKDEYSQSLEFEPCDTPLPPIDAVLASKLLSQLYARPLRQVFLYAEDQAKSHATVLAIWGQQWPRLRRNFCFCSLTARDRSTSEHCFDVQFLSTRKKERRSAIEHRFDDQEGWMNLCLDDLRASNFAFREFLRRAGGDIKDGRGRFAELCQLFAQRISGSQVNAVEQTLRYVIHRLPLDEGKLLRSAAISDAVECASEISTACLVDMLPYLEEVKGHLSASVAKGLAKKYWEIDPLIVVGPDAITWIRELGSQVIDELSQQEALDSALDAGELATSILVRRTDLLENDSVWRADISETAIELLPSISEEDQQIAILHAIINAPRRDLVDLVCRTFGVRTVLAAATSKCMSESDVAVTFAAKAFAAMPDREKFVCHTLVEERCVLNRRLIYLFAESVSPSVPEISSDQSLDPWVAVWEDGKGELGSKKTDDVMTFLFLRAVIEPSAHAASLLACSYDHLMDRCKAHKLSYSRRARLSSYLVLSDWFDWSFESRLTRTVAKIASEKEFSGLQLRHLSKSKQRLRRVVEAIGAVDPQYAALTKLDNMHLDVGSDEPDAN